VAQISVVGMAATVIGELGAAFVVPTDPAAPPSLSELRGFVRQHLADYKCPDELVLVDDLPLTPMMKVDKDDLRRRFTDVVAARSGARHERRKAVGKLS
jgi:non-ribosomal peptide synthetase component E (peptide arylation enzyme)